MNPRASILAIGTELTTGQITNRNAVWISQKLENLGVEVVLHEAVADDRPMMRDAIHRCLGVSQLLFITGGLGPTSDDFTREVVADYLRVPLEYDESAWERIKARLTGLGIPVAECNRQQCYFPKGAQVLENPAGTASGFRMETGRAVVWVLPGPPREVSGIWEQTQIEADIHTRFPALRPLELHTWQCMGKSEAELSELTEAALQGSGVKVGYRAHRPYVEIKVWIPQGDTPKFKKTFDALEKAIGPWVVTRQGEDLAELLLKKLSSFEEIEIADCATGGVLAERIGRWLRDPAFRSQEASVALVTEWAGVNDPKTWVRQSLAQSDPDSLCLAVAGYSADGEWVCGLRWAEQNRVETFRAPFKIPELHDRNLLYSTELAFKHWLQWLAEMTQ